jgi:ribonuclease VapC
MIVIDTSVIVACLAREPLSDIFFKRLLIAQCKIGTPTHVETALWLCRNGNDHSQKLWTEINNLETVSLAPFTADMARWANHAVNLFGKGSGHKAQLNFGDCLSYGVAKALDAPLLFTGDDFTHTDLIAA